MQFWDKLLPLQDEYTSQFNGSDYPQELYQVICQSSGITDPYSEFEIEQDASISQEEMGSNPVSMQFLRFLMRLNGTKRVLEIGTFIGLSAMSFARALPEDGEVVTIEKFDRFAALARRNIERNNLTHKISVLEGDAFEAIDTLPDDRKFDLVFIDGNKEQYREYFIKTERLLSPNGIIVVDDCFFHGDAVNTKPTSAKGVGVKAFLDYAGTRDDFVRIALPISNGIYLMVRR